MARNYDSFGNLFKDSEINKIGNKIFGTKMKYFSNLVVDKFYVEDKVKKFNNIIKNFHTVDELIKIEIDDLRPGPAIANALVFETQNRNVNIQKNLNKISKLFRSYINIYASVINDIEKNNSSIFLIYNGRFLHERAVWDSAKQRGKIVLIYETLRDRYHVRDFGFHDRIANQKLMIDLWNKSDLSLSDRSKIGSKYFLDLKSKSNKYYLNENSNAMNFEKYFVFFTNSDDEAIGFWESWKENFMNQKESIEYLSNWFALHPEYKFVVRLHPNLLSKPEEIQKEWLNLNLDSNTKLIKPGDEISSYSLMLASKGVISFGSTIGLEASYNEIPSLVLADCWYDELNAVTKANNVEEMLEWIENVSSGVSITKKSKDGALIRGYWMEMSGNKFRNTTLKEQSWGSWQATNFNGMPIQKSVIRKNIHILINKIKRYIRGFNRK